MASSYCRFDRLYRRFLLTKYFTKGWGTPDDMRRILSFRRTMSIRENAVTIADPASHPITYTKEETHKDHRIVEGFFESPAKPHLPGLLPVEAQKAYFQMVLPRNEATFYPSGRRPVCIQFAGTGDHFFYRRRHLMALPMVRERGIASVILENPFYGPRKPKDQLRSSLRNVTDIFVMGACLMLESIVLSALCEREGLGPVVMHGISMGGHMASLAATVAPRPVCCVPCLIWTSASLTFTEGVIAEAIPWEVLQAQFATTSEYGNEIFRVVKCEENGFQPEMNMTYRYGQWKEALSDSKEQREYPSGGKLASSVGIPWLRTMKSNETDEALRQDSIRFMRGIMDECTHLRNFDLPLDPELAIVVLAERDAYQPREGVSAIPDIWKGAKIRYIDNMGHVASYILKQNVFREAVYDVLDQYEENYPEAS